MNGRQTLWINGKVYTPHGVIEQGRMLVDGDGRIAAVGGPELAAGEQAEVRDAQGYAVVPGMIDVHVHGALGYSVLDGTEESLRRLSRFFAEHGTTSFLATTSTASPERLTRALQNAAAAVKQELPGADLLGIHLEGPFINEKRRGAQSLADIRKPTIEAMERYWHAADGMIRLVTLAPETEGGMEAVSWFSGKGATVSIGHSDARFDEVTEAIARGARHTTHHFNGMSPFHHREPGVAGAGLMLSELTTEVIADGIHVHPAAVKFLFETKGAENVCAVTDAVFACGLPDGEYGRVKVTNGEIRLADGSSLAGSSLTMIRALQNVVRFTGWPLEKVLPAFTETPARQIGAERQKGSLAPGKDADFLLLDADLSLAATYVRGKPVYVREAH